MELTTDLVFWSRVPGTRFPILSCFQYLLSNNFAFITSKKILLIQFHKYVCGVSGNRN